MKLLGAGNIEDAQGIIDSQGTAKKLTYKLQLGHQYRLFLYLTQVGPNNMNSIISATQPGRKLDFDIFGTEFVAIDEFDYDESTKQVTDTTVLDKYGRISHVMFKAREMSAIDEVKERAESTAKKLKTKINTEKVQKDMEDVRIEYEGTKINGQTVYPVYNEAIQNFYCYTFTSGVIVDMGTANDIKVGDKVSLRYVDLSRDKIARLRELVKEADRIDIERGYIELQFKYIGDDTKAAGQGAFPSLTHVSEAEKICTKFESAWNVLRPSIEGILPKTQEIMASKNPKLRTQSIQNIVKTFKDYIRSNMVFFTYIPLDADVLRGSAKSLLEEFSDEISQVTDLQNYLLDLVGSNSASTSSDTGSTLTGVENFEKAITSTNLNELSEATNNLQNYDALNPTDEDSDGFKLGSTDEEYPFN